MGCLRFRGVFVDLYSPDTMRRFKDFEPHERKLHVELDCIYTLTTLQPTATAFAYPLTWANSGRRRAFPRRHKDDFEDTAPGRQGRFLADMSGAFEIVKSGTTQRGQVLRQMTEKRPACWEKDLLPVTLFGDRTASQMSLSALVLPGTVGTFLGTNSMWTPSSYMNLRGCGLYFGVLPTAPLDRGGALWWHVFRSLEDVHKRTNVVDERRLKFYVRGTWLDLHLDVREHASAFIDGKQVWQGEAPHCSGWFALVASGYGLAEFDDLEAEIFDTPLQHGDRCDVSHQCDPDDTNGTICCLPGGKCGNTKFECDCPSCRDFSFPCNPPC